MFKSLRYWISSTLIGWGIDVIPDEYPKQRLIFAINFAADMMLNELQVYEDDEEDGVPH